MSDIEIRLAILGILLPVTDPKRPMIDVIKALSILEQWVVHGKKYEGD